MQAPLIFFRFANSVKLEIFPVIREQSTIYNPQIVLIEDKASGTQLIQDLKVEGMPGIKRHELPACDKIMRLNAQSVVFENGLVLLPKEAYWLTDYINELTSFPGCKYDDQVDSTSQALEFLRVKGSEPRIRRL